MSDERPWYEDLDPDEYARMFPRGQVDVDAWIERDAWREQHQGMPRTCDDPGVLEDLARIILGSGSGGRSRQSWTTSSLKHGSTPGTSPPPQCARTWMQQGRAMTSDELHIIDMWQAQQLERLRELNARPWRGACPQCRGMLWCTDTEEEARQHVLDHIAKDHVITPWTWKAEEDP